MFDFKGRAEVRSKINVRTEVHGDETVPEIDVQVMALDVPVDRLSTACPDIGKRFYEGEQVAIGEVNPLIVGHKIENLTVKIGAGDDQFTMKGVNIKKGAKIKLKPGKVADVLMMVQTEHHDDLVVNIMPFLREEVPFEVSERQLKLADMP